MKILSGMLIVILFGSRVNLQKILGMYFKISGQLK
jgi:hypothetical protein